MAIARFDPDQTSLLVVDLQERLLPVIHDHEAVVSQAGRLLDGAKVLGLPVLVTEQYKKGLGETVPAISEKLGAVARREEKLLFSACIEPVLETLGTLDRHAVLVCGIEAHVCVLQTCLDLIDRGYVVGLVIDATGSRRPTDQAAAVQRVTQAGVVPTTVESVLLEMVREAGTDRFKAMLPIIK